MLHSGEGSISYCAGRCWSGGIPGETLGGFTDVCLSLHSHPPDFAFASESCLWQLLWLYSVSFMSSAFIICNSSVVKICPFPHLLFFIQSFILSCGHLCYSLGFHLFLICGSHCCTFDLGASLGWLLCPFDSFFLALPYPLVS